MTAWTELTSTIWWLLEEHGLLVSFVLLFLEECGLPPIIPGDLLMVLVGYQAAQGRFRLITGLVVLEIATVLGGSVLYWISAVGGQAIVNKVGRYVGATPERLQKIATSLERHGAMAIVIGRLVPSLCILTAVAAGLLGFPYRRFVPALALGGFIHLFVFVMLGYWFGPPVLRVLSTFHPSFELITAVASLAILIGWLIWSVRRRRPTPDVVLSRTERLQRGLVAGLLAALASTLLANALLPIGGLLHPSSTGTSTTSELAEYASARTIAIAVVVAMLVVSILWGAAFGFMQPVLRGPLWLRGVIFAAVPLALSLLVVLPLTGGGWLGLGLGIGPLPILAEVVRAVAYGLTLGTAYTLMSPGELTGARAGSPAG